MTETQLPSPLLTPDSPAFSGVWPALLTPLHVDHCIDHIKFAAHARNLIDCGCPGVTAFGTTGEGPSFSMAERKEAIDHMIENGIPAAQIMVSTSCAALPETLELTRHAVQAGVHGCLMLPPFFLKGVSDQGVIDCYRYVLDAMAGTPLRLYLYHIPQVTGVSLSPHVIATLKLLYPQAIVGIKDSAGNLSHSVGLAEAFMKDLKVYVGHEPDLQEMRRRGSTGAISGLANFMPRVVKRLTTDSEAAADLKRVIRMIDLLHDYSLMPALKGVMAILSGDKSWLRVRAPLVALASDQLTALGSAVRDFGIDPRVD